MLSEVEMSTVLNRFGTYGKQAKDIAGEDSSKLAVYAPVHRDGKSLMQPKVLLPVPLKKPAKG